jgi:hypothetical protein
MGEEWGFRTSDFGLKSDGVTTTTTTMTDALPVFQSEIRNPKSAIASLAEVSKIPGHFEAEKSQREPTLCPTNFTG